MSSGTDRLATHTTRISFPQLSVGMPVHLSGSVVAWVHPHSAQLSNVVGLDALNFQNAAKT